MISKREFIKSGLWTASLAGFGGVASVISLLWSNGGAKADSLGDKFFMPDEASVHKCTWMAFVASEDIWDKNQSRDVQYNLINIAKTISNYETVNMLVGKKDKKLANKLINKQNKYKINLIEFEINDFWMRDTAPIFTVNKNKKKTAIDFNFNGWGDKQIHNLDSKIAKFVAMKSNAKHLKSNLTLEGGCFEVDGQGTAIMTESCILNANRNPNTNKKNVEKELKKLLGLSKIIWLKGIKGKDITDAHTDFYVRFASQTQLIVSRDIYAKSYDYKITRDYINFLRTATNARGERFKLVLLDTPFSINEKYGISEFAAGYLGYYICNGAVIMQKFGDKKADSAAKSKLQKAFPNHHIEQISTDAIASGGGTIHCTTQQEPLIISF